MLIGHEKYRHYPNNQFIDDEIKIHWYSFGLSNVWYFTQIQFVFFYLRILLNLKHNTAYDTVYQNQYLPIQ